MAERAQWGSKFGFILAASGSAIGLGNIVFFSANAYRNGAGAFYIPYLIALILVGIPIMIMEFGLGHNTRKAFPQALLQVAGRKGEFIGWWAILNACFITLYYITILGWVLGMWVGAFGQLWKDALPVPSLGVPAGEKDVPWSFFFQMISEWKTVGFVVIIWVLNAMICWKGVKTIEAAVKVFVPLMWIFMLVLIVRGLTLPHGTDGVLFLFTPDFEGIRDTGVWQGAFSQIFFTLSLGFGIMTTYASYLPKDSDQTNNAVMTSCLNCSFEFVAGVAIFSILFVFAIVPEGGTLGMMFFVVPKGIAELPALVRTFGILFFTMLLLAGLSSSVSLVEALVSSLQDKFGALRSRLILIVTVFGAIGSGLFALPQVVDQGWQEGGSLVMGAGTLGFSLLDMIDHWAFGYGLLIAGLVECLLIGWIFGAGRLADSINASSKFRLGKGFITYIRFVLPVILGAVIVMAIWREIDESWLEEGATGLYGAALDGSYKPDLRSWLSVLPYVTFGFWVLGPIVGSYFLTRARGKEESHG